MPRIGMTPFLAQFDETYWEEIARLTDRGWEVTGIDDDGYTFAKRDWRCRLDGSSNTIMFERKHDTPQNPETDG